ncbi:Protein-tyrosine-phosphatase MKP1 [Forsythia ovata]|uniref:Protein-tyrosine-phosphatase MKP1 n=1 Tax=Forsythia ovata TaxID=205694 RepID=A0ABD1W866_9LAMI
MAEAGIMPGSSIDGGPHPPLLKSNIKKEDLTQKLYWRSMSWSSSRTSLPPLNPDADNKDGLNLNGNNNSNSGMGQRIPPLTPRTQHSFKAKSCLPAAAIGNCS